MAIDYVAIAYVLTSAGTFVSAVGGFAIRWHDRNHPHPRDDDRNRHDGPDAPDVADNHDGTLPPHPPTGDAGKWLRSCFPATAVT